jgi:hypothetical protein
MFKEKYDEMAKKIHECIVSQFTEEETKWYELYCRIVEAREREQELLNSACVTLMREEANAKREETKSQVSDNSNS